METISSILPTFVGKIEDAVSMVAAMPAEEKLKAVQYWNAVSEKLQEIVNDSAADISALAFKGEKAEFISPAHLGLSVGTQQHLLTAPTVMGMVAQNVGIISTRNRGRRLRSGIQDENGSREALMSFLATLPTQPPGTTDVAISTDPVVEEIAIAAQNPVIDDAEKDKEENEDGNVDEDDDDDDVDNDGPDEVDDDDLTGKSFVDFSAAVAELGVQHDIASELKATDSATLHLMISADPSTTHEASEVQKKRRKKTKSGEEVEEVYYECEYCKKTFGTPSQLTAHRWTHTKPYICLDCKARFSTRGNLMVHRRRHTGEKPYPCDKCDAKFSTKGNLKRHIKAHSGEKPWECTQCGGRFTEKKSLKVHMRRHTGEKPYQCKVCFKRFAQSGILQTHMAMHLNQKTHLCELCGKSFRQRSQLRLHTQRHAGVRKFDCDICPAKFLTKGDMERHRRTHTGERPFVCELCGKPFTRQQSLNEHMNRHYGLKPYECKYCGKGFAEMSACYKHIKSHERSAKDDMTEQLVNSIRNQVQDSQCASSQEPAKYTVLLHADQSLDVGREMVVTGVANSSLPEETQQVTVTVSEDIQEFAAINLLASASTFQQAF